MDEVNNYCILIGYQNQSVIADIMLEKNKGDLELYANAILFEHLSKAQIRELSSKEYKNGFKILKSNDSIKIYRKTSNVLAGYLWNTVEETETLFASIEFTNFVKRVEPEEVAKIEPIIFKSCVRKVETRDFNKTESYNHVIDELKEKIKDRLAHI